MNPKDLTFLPLRITAETHPPSLSLIDVDEYVPLRWRSYAPPLGVGYLRLGDFNATLLELAIEPRTQAVRGVTLTSIDCESAWPSFQIEEASESLPSLDANCEAAEIRDVRCELRAAASGAEVLIWWSELGECNALGPKNARFLVRDGNIVGVRFAGLDDEQREAFAAHLSRR